MLVNSPAPVNSNSIKGDLVEVAAGNGYSAGGPSVVITASSQSGGTYALVGNDIVIVASGGSIAAFRYAVLYNSTPVSPLKPLIGYYDYGSSITLNSGESLTIDFGSSILTLQ